MLGGGILGAGFFGACHARAVAALKGARVVAACAEELPLAEAFTAEHGGKAYGDWRVPPPPDFARCPWSNFSER
jgi:phthalate 4,5-cis-dihydrodiol dehydrogenase